MYGILQVDKGKVVDGAFLDFYKAVHHSILLENIVQLWDERVHNAVGEELAECQSWKDCDKWGYIWLSATD